MKGQRKAVGLTCGESCRAGVGDVGGAAGPEAAGVVGWLRGAGGGVALFDPTLERGKLEAGSAQARQHRHGHVSLRPTRIEPEGPACSGTAVKGSESR